MNSIAQPAARQFGRRVSHLPAQQAGADEPQSDLLRDLKIFSTAWLGWFVFFGTFLA